jgi:rhamnulokinase
MTSVVAVDLGNESGRIMLVSFDGAALSSRELYRFPNNPLSVRGTLFWDILRLWHEIQHGLTLAFQEQPDGIAVDSFGVDFGLLDERGDLIGNPVHMRDGRTEGVMERVSERIPRDQLYQRTGIGFYPINTLYQLVALAARAPWQLEAARTLLTIPNLLNYWMTGECLSEFTHSTTTQCFNPTTGDWDRETLSTLNLPTHIFPSIVYPGTQLGSYQNIPVYAAASHDTGSAVVAVPAGTQNYAYISSGTWSLFGLETNAPILTPAAMNANITNEGGAYDTYHPLKLVMGLWLLQQCRAVWAREGAETDYQHLLPAAQAAPALVSLIDPDDSRFFPPGDMPSRIRAFCQQTGQPVPADRAALVRCILESLALKYRYVLEQLIQVSGRPVDVLHIVGGGAQNLLLCQMTADATGRVVLAGPVEATALGNGLVQLIARGELHDLADARYLLRASLPPVRYEPAPGGDWDAAYERFKSLITVP